MKHSFLLILVILFTSAASAQTKGLRNACRTPGSNTGTHVRQGDGPTANSRPGAEVRIETDSLGNQWQVLKPLKPGGPERKVLYRPAGSSNPQIRE